MLKIIINYLPLTTHEIQGHDFKIVHLITIHNQN